MTKRNDGIEKNKSVPVWKIKVTREDFEAAKPGDSSHCMIARAVARAVGCPERFVSVDLQLIEFSDPKRHLRLSYLTPDAAQQALLDFDNGDHVAPFELVMRRPIQVRQADLGRPRDPAPVKPSDVVRAGERNARQAELEAKRDRGEPLTRTEKGSLTRMATTDKAGGRTWRSGVSTAKRVVPPANKNQHARIEGGDRPIVPQKNRTLGNRKGQRRRYGLRQAKTK